MAAAGAGGHERASLVIAGDETLRDLNRRFRGLDEITDVLSFGRSAADDYSGEADAPQAETSGFAFPQTPEDEGMLGR